jgi:hypothetical protein
VVGVPLDAPLVALFCGPLQGLLTHRVGRESIPCAGEGVCMASTHKARTVWHGYAPGRYFLAARNLWLPAVLQVTENMEEQLADRDLAGEVWLLVREVPNQKNSPVTGQFLERRNDKDLVTPFAVKPVLCHMYHVADLALGAKNPIPRKVSMPSVQAAPPAGIEILYPPPPPPEDPALREEALRKLRQARSELFKANGRK